ncbi:spore germination protein [Jeotgalibacillus sp. ET6]|uniref:spore germination protein n=1 Tax=Jeotgalibacillus sp. ET6 TaxID=3037260 RepID=UPI0024183BFB|nr:spore germination protein [Jeotgalibacillus sp. ET6]MDG5473198.1 spore germination protein [Jeotgalibacillus sp. ET6]
MNSLIKEIKDSIGDNDDLFFTEHQLTDLSVVFIGLNSLVDLGPSIKQLEKMGQKNYSSKEKLKQISQLGEIKRNASEITSLLLEGKLMIAISLNSDSVVSVDPVPVKLNRAIDQITNENTMLGPLVSFNEDSLTNIGVMRKQLLSEKIRVKHFRTGIHHKKALSLIYYEGIVEENLLETVVKEIKGNSKSDLYSLQDVTKMLGITPYSIVPRVKTTEIPSEAAQSLLKGKIVLFLDGLPFALILPSVFIDMFFLESDKNLTFPLMISLRSLRIAGTLIALIFPGLYVALVAVNPEVLRLELALSIAQSREGVPYPAFIEIIIMLVVLELIMEASVRLPKSIGPTITMVGGIILGQAAVEAQLVSNLLVIVLAATTIANSTVIGVQNLISIRLLKYIVLIFSSVFGVLGILAGVFFICAYLAGVSSIGVPYLNFKHSKGEGNNG